MARLDDGEGREVTVTGGEDERDTVQFTWPCGETFTFPTEQLLDHLKRLRRAQQTIGGPVLARLSEDYPGLFLRMDDQDAVSAHYDVNEAEATFEWEPLRRALQAVRREQAKAAA